MESLGAAHNLVVDSAGPVPQFVTARVGVHSKLETIWELFAVFPHKWSFSFSLHPVAYIVPNRNPISSAFFVQAWRGEHQALATLVPHSRTKLVVTFNVWSLCIAFCLGIKGGVENVQVEVGQGGFVGGLVARIWKEEATSERVLECKPRRLVDVVNYFVRHLLALGETKAENQQQKHPVDRRGPPKEYKRAGRTGPRLKTGADHLLLFGIKLAKKKLTAKIDQGPPLKEK